MKIMCSKQLSCFSKPIMYIWRGSLNHIWWVCVQGLFLTKIRGSSGFLRIKYGLAMCRSSVLSYCFYNSPLNNFCLLCFLFSQCWGLNISLVTVRQVVYNGGTSSGLLLLYFLFVCLLVFEPHQECSVAIPGSVPRACSQLHLVDR